ncbi:MAG: hypothetical protein MUE30_13530 [Spirosomaceae bacterium]|nr:hypothetical protein [Spirosomataceae bacterium]
MTGVDVGVAWQNKGYAPSLHYYQMLKIGGSGVLQAGWGLRAAQSVGNQTDFTSAPAKFANKTSTTDTLQMNRFTSTSLNMNVSVQLSLMNRIDIGANLDLFGLATGGRRTGYHLGSRGFSMIDSLNTHRTFQTARPTVGAFQLIGNNTVGNLNAELYGRIYFTKYVGMKIGYVFATNEYRTDRALVSDNRRFRARTQMIYAGITFRIPN